MVAQSEIAETLQEALSLLYLLETDLSIHEQDRIYTDTIRIARQLVKEAIENLN